MSARDNLMEQRIHVLAMGPHEYAVTVSEGMVTTNHHVAVSERFIDDLGIWELDEKRLVEETFAYLLERVPASAISHDVDLDKVADEHDDYIPEVKTRLA